MIRNDRRGVGSRVIAGTSVCAGIAVAVAWGGCPAARGADKPVAVEGWGQLTDPKGDCKLRTDGDEVVFELPAGNYDLWPKEGQVNAPRLTQPTKGDFTIEVTAKNVPLPDVDATITGHGSAFHAGTLLVWQDAKNFVRLDRGAMIKDGREVHFAYYHIFVNGERVTHLSQALTDKPTRLRIERRKGKIHAAFSQNEGKSWSSFAAQDDQLGTDVEAGVAALNVTTKPFTVKFEKLSLAVGK